jgi:hypothetical protein
MRAIVFPLGATASRSIRDDIIVGARNQVLSNAT